MQHQENAVAARLVLSVGERELRSIPISKPALLIGRRPGSDIALDDLTVSGEHARVQGRGADFVVRDLNSRNGTQVNGSAISEHLLEHGDVIEIGVYRLRYEIGRCPAEGDADVAPQAGFLDYLNDLPPGRTIAVDRAIVPVHGPSQVAVVSRRKNGFFITHLEGLALPVINGEPIGLSARPLLDGDLIELSGSLIRFRTEPA
jgi:pSer/pThr/pTyr-binding forkhead associated (FHA) protein